jgi:beta-glucanase (GH16 family)
MKTTSLILLLIVITAACSKGKNNQGESTPKLSFDDVSIAEGTGGAVNVQISLVLDHAYSKQVTVTYSTIDGTAKGGQDFTAVTNATVTFLPNETQKTILIPVTTDDIKEADEIFQVRVENPVNVFLLKGTAIVTLRNDDTRIGFNNTGFDAPTSYAGYTLSWSDEFNGSSLDASAWSGEVGDGCPGVCGWGNNELEYYMSPPNNLIFQDGKLIIEARKETYGGKNYTSARLKTQGKKTFKFGRIDIRALLPKGLGIWPALWLLPQDNVYGNWPKSGEIDLMELKGGEASKVLGTLHFGPGPNSTFISRNYTLPAGNFNDQFHVFSLEWEQDQIKWYVDNTLYSTITKADVAPNNYPFNENFFFLINLAVGGNFPGDPDANTSFPAWMIVDYIRVYQK